MRLLLLLMVVHFVVDLVATVINPLWPTLKTHSAGSEWSLFWLLLTWSTTTSVTQVAFGIWGDQRHIRWTIWAGPALAALCLGCIGYFHATWILAGLTIAAGLGIAAFHPEAASLAGNTMPYQRSRAMSLFQFSGFLGQTVGPYYSGVIVERWGLEGLLPGLLWLLLALLVLRFPLRRLAPTDPSIILPQRVRVTQLLGGRGRELALLLSIGVTRIIPAAGVPLALAFLTSARQANTSEIGLVQSAFLFGLGGGGLLCALGLAQRLERTIMWLSPLLAALIILSLPLLTGFGLLAAAVLGGTLLGASLPVFIGLGQQLLPHSQRVGSSITMGLSWGIGGGIAAVTTAWFERLGEPARAFPLFSIAALASSLLCLLLPHSTSSDQVPEVARSSATPAPYHPSELAPEVECTSATPATRPGTPTMRRR